MQETRVRSLVQEDPLEKEMSTLLQYSAWQAAVPGITKSLTRLSNWTTTSKCDVKYQLLESSKEG